MIHPRTRHMAMLAALVETKPETYWELLRRRYPFQVQKNGRINWYLRVNEAGHLAISLHGLPEVDLFLFAQKHGSVQLNILPILRETVHRRQDILQRVTRRVNYTGKYLGNAYAGKANEYYYVTKATLLFGDHYETSAPAGVDAAMWLNQEGVLPNNRYVICNGYYPEEYVKAIKRMRRRGFVTIIPVLDKPNLLRYFTNDTGPETYMIGVRRKARHGIESTNEADRHTSPFGMRFAEIQRVAEEIKAAPNATLVLYHMHLGTQIEDEEEFLASLKVGIEEYCQLKKDCDTLHIFDIGGGVPVAYSLAGIPFNLERFWRNLLLMVKATCRKYNVPEPDILTEFGRHTASAHEMRIWRLIDLYDHRYQLDGTIMGSLPDHWGIGQNFLVLPTSNFYDRHWNYFSIRGLTCDEDDEYREKVVIGRHLWQKLLLKIARSFGLLPGVGLIPLPVMKPQEEESYVAFCETGAYQEMIGQMEHCLRPEKQELIGDIVNRCWQWDLIEPEESSLDMLRDMHYPV